MFVCSRNTLMTIPRIIHQIWWQGESHIPAKFHDYLTDVKRFCAKKQFQHRVWDEHSCMAVVQEVFPHGIDAMQSLALVEKCDMCRIAILYKFGGVYLDMDFEIEMCFDEFVDAYDTPKHRTVMTLDGLVVNNFLIVSTQGNPMMVDVFESCLRRIKDPPLLSHLNSEMKTMCTTGPYVYTEFLHMTKYNDVFQTIHNYVLDKYGRHHTARDWVTSDSSMFLSQKFIDVGKTIDEGGRAFHDLSVAYVENIRDSYFVSIVAGLGASVAAFKGHVLIGMFVVMTVMYLDSRMFTEATGRPLQNHTTAWLYFAATFGMTSFILWLTKSKEKTE